MAILFSTQFDTSTISTSYPDPHFVSKNWGFKMSHNKKAGNPDLRLSMIPYSPLNS